MFYMSILFMCIFFPFCMAIFLILFCRQGLFSLLEDFTNFLAIMLMYMQLFIKDGYIVLLRYVSFSLSKLKAFSYQFSSTHSLRLITVLALLILLGGGGGGGGDVHKIQVLLVSVIGTWVDCQLTIFSKNLFSKRFFVPMILI